MRRPLKRLPGVALLVLSFLSGCKQQPAMTPIVPEPPQPLTGVLATVYRLDQGQTVKTDPFSYTFRNGDKVRIGITSVQPGYFYIVNRGTTGRLTVLFPSRKIKGGTNQIGPSEEIIVPSEGWFEFKGPPGEEILYSVYSTAPTGQVLDALNGVLGYLPGPSVGTSVGGTPNTPPFSAGPGGTSAETEASILAQLNSKARDFVMPTVPPGSSTPGGVQGPYLPYQPGLTVGVVRLRHG